MKKKVWQLDYACNVGDRVWWGTIRGDRFEGTLIKMEDNVAHVKMDNGEVREVEC